MARTPILGSTAFTETGLVTAIGDSITGVTLGSAGTASSASVAGGPMPSRVDDQGTGLANYAITYAAGGALTVNPASIAVTTNSDSSVYGTSPTNPASRP